MRYKFLFVMDPFETLNLATETSLLMMAELLERGHEVYWLEFGDISLSSSADDAFAGGVLYGAVSRVEQVSPVAKKALVIQRLDQFDAVLLRVDPPIDQRYMHLSLLLETLPIGQFNAISSLRQFNEKLLCLRWPSLTPPTLVTASSKDILGFLKTHGKIVLKPLDDCSGRGISLLKFPEHGIDAIDAIDKYLANNSSFVIAQRFLPEISQGDKRVFVLDGEAVGWVNRVPKPGGFLANIHQGAMCEACELSDFEIAAIKQIAPFLRAQGILFAGLDFIGNHLTEINITSPSAVRQINTAMGIRLEIKLVDAMLTHLDRRVAA